MQKKIGKPCRRERNYKPHHEVPYYVMLFQALFYPQIGAAEAGQARGHCHRYGERDPFYGRYQERGGTDQFDKYRSHKTYLSHLPLVGLERHLAEDQSARRDTHACYKYAPSGIDKTHRDHGGYRLADAVRSAGEGYITARKGKHRAENSFHLPLFLEAVKVFYGF